METELEAFVCDWVHIIDLANPGYSNRLLEKTATKKDYFFFNWFLDLTAQLL